MKRPTLRLLTAATFAAFFSLPANAANLGLTIDTLLKGLNENAQAAGSSITAKKVGCREGKNPMNPSQKVTTCSHVIGDGKVLISNSDLSGPLIGINTQRWEAGTDGPAVQMTTWLASAVTNTPADSHKAAANKAVEEAVANKTSSMQAGDYTIYLMDFGNSIAITVSPI